MFHRQQPIPDSIVDSLHALERKEILTEEQEVELDTFLCGLETALVNPANSSKILVNPVPNEPDVSLRPEKSLEERIKHINTVSHRIRQQMMPESEEEALDFDSIDDSFDLLPRSIFEVGDHESQFIEETVSPKANLDIRPNEDIDPPELEPTIEEE